MDAENVELMYEQESYYELPEPTSDIQLPPVLNILLLALWVLICLIGFAIIFFSKNIFLGIVVIGVPTFFGMVTKPTFALCVLMLVLPTGAGVGIEQVFTLNRGVGIAVAIAFTLNLLISRPRLRIGNKALWILVAYTIWVLFTSLAAPYFALEIRNAFTMFQLLALVFIVYLILETNSPNTLIWALRSYVVGSLGTTVLAYITGAAMISMEAERGRYAATVGRAIEPNMMSALIGLAFLTAIYLFARDRHILFRIIYLIAIVLLPIMILKTGSRGGSTALAFALMSPLLFIRQVWRKPALAALLVVIIVLASGAAAFLVKTRGLEEEVSERLTDVGQIRQAAGYRMELMKKAAQSSLKRPTGTSRYGWFEQANALSYPHSDFFYALGIYGIPGGMLFVFFAVMMMLTVKRIPLGVEKLYARTILIFLLVNGMSMGQLGQKHFWTFFAIVMAIERISWFNANVTEDVRGETDEKNADINY